MTGLILIFLAGVAEFFKDLSEEGKLKGYWDKHKMVSLSTDWSDLVTPATCGRNYPMRNGVWI